LIRLEVEIERLEAEEEEGAGSNILVEEEEPLVAIIEKVIKKKN
jgi:hypothetical protein